jgi:hypothetical protein
VARTSVFAALARRINAWSASDPRSAPKSSDRELVETSGGWVRHWIDRTSCGALVAVVDAHDESRTAARQRAAAGRWDAVGRIPFRRRPNPRSIPDVRARRVKVT